ncbi:hypothetical protein GUJ93_ZPchr0003g18276 [Zizania palustris]|uniref:HMA domain-containing protein n=1 Tax=Zizania palustris TaxID=103762 RepID=A0A8J5V7H3_ZIZPA|nr:hypothetical protein GUJ93_ZPchr0003g18276 [Zizania palustris]
MASAEVVAPAVAQTVVLRVSIDCMGCKKKVRKVLRSIEGVHDVKVDAAMHKVTVTGTVDGDTLVRRLYKSGKQALPWRHPHTPPVAPAKKAEAAPEPVAPAPAGDAAADKKPEEQAVKEAAPAAESSEKKTAEQGAESENKGHVAEKGAEPEKKEEETKPSVEAKKDASQSEAAETKGGNGSEPIKESAPPAPAAAKQAGNDGDEEKEKSKPKEAGDAVPVLAAATTERSPFPPPAAPKHAHEEPYYPYPYYAAPQPVLSYHMAQPSASVSYYAPQPETAYSVKQQQPSPPPPPQPQPQPQQQPPPQPQPMQQHWSPSYLYMPYPHSTPDSYYHDYYSPPGTQALPPLHDSYRMFDDENPNACRVM